MIPAMLLFTIACLLIFTSLYGKSRNKAGVYAGLLLFAFSVAFALLSGVDYEICAIVCLVLFIAMAGKEESK